MTCQLARCNERELLPFVKQLKHEMQMFARHLIDRVS